MRKTIKNLLERSATIVAVVVTLLIAFLSLKTIHFEKPINLSFFDKVLHFGAYFFLTIVWLFSQREKNNKSVVLLSIFFYGILLEYFQAWFAPNRVKDFYDALANGIGIIFAAILFKYLYKYYKSLFGNTK